MKIFFFSLIFGISMLANASIVCTSNVRCYPVSDPYGTCQAVTLVFPFPLNHLDYPSAVFSNYSFQKNNSNMENALIPKNLNPGYPKRLQISHSTLRQLNLEKPSDGITGGFKLWEKTIDNPRYADYFGAAQFRNLKGVLRLQGQSYPWQLICPF